MNAPTPAPALPGAAPLRTAISAFPDGPLSAPLRRLAQELDALVHAGELLGIDLDLTHPDCPCLLLAVAPGRPRLYVELFLDDPDEPVGDDGWSEDGDNPPLCVLMNRVGSDTAPDLWQTGLEAEGAVDFTDLLSLIRILI